MTTEWPDRSLHNVLDPPPVLDARDRARQLLDGLNKAAQKALEEGGAFAGVYMTPNGEVPLYLTTDVPANLTDTPEPLAWSTFGRPEKWAKFVIQEYDRAAGRLLFKPKQLQIVYSNGRGWEHVSVSRPKKIPTYQDMEFVKQAFWGPDVTVMQLHVPAKDHVNLSTNCLHLWRPTRVEIPRPIQVLV